MEARLFSRRKAFGFGLFRLIGYYSRLDNVIAPEDPEVVDPTGCRERKEGGRPDLRDPALRLVARWAANEP